MCCICHFTFRNWLINLSVYRAQAGLRKRYDLESLCDDGSLALGRLLLMFSSPPQNELLFFLSKIKSARCPLPQKCFNCQTLVDSHCFELVSISDADFTIIKASQFQRLVQLLPLNYHRLWVNNLLFHTIVHGDVLRFPKSGSVSPLSAIPPVKFQSVYEKGHENKKHVHRIQSETINFAVHQDESKRSKK